MEIKTPLFIVFLLYIGNCSCQNQPPVFVNNMNGLSIYESVEVGTSVYTLSARDETEVRYSTETEIFSVNAVSGVVILNKKLDYEDGTIELSVRFFATDTEGLETVVDSTINIIDDNDNPPTFSRETYERTVPEDLPVNGVIYDDLVVTDVDFKGGNIEVVCNPEAALHNNSNGLKIENYIEACQTFAPVMNWTTNQKWTGRMVLLKPLDFEKRGSYQVPLETSDGTNRRLQTFELLLSDVEDSPPRFTNLTEVIRVEENTPLNTMVGWAIAIDGDRSNPRDIVYEPTQCSVQNTTRKDGREVFSVHETTGAIRIKSPIDREQELFQSGLILCVKAREMINDTTVGDDFETTSVATVRVDIEDLNDEIPTFNTSNYNTSIYEDVANGSPVPGVAVTVSDNDLSPSNRYNIRLINYQDIFGIFPNNGSGRTIGIIKVIDSSQIDYESAVKKYELYIVAKEIDDAYRVPKTATVTIHVLDRNDNSPTFYVQSYNVSVKETDSGADPIIRNILAIDPDSGWMGTSGLRYSLLGSGFENFNIVKSQQRGLEIKVAQCATPGRENCLDFERRRRYDFTIVAEDMEGDRRGRQGTSDLTIHILDVNDNKPMFILNSFAASIYEGKTLTVNPLVVTANDSDTIGKVSYSLQPDDQSRHWWIDKTTGNITAIDPIYNTFTPNKRGWFNLTVIANDTVNIATADVRIDVIEVNAFSPVFQNLGNVTYIPENIEPNSYVFTVFATDDDPSTSNNGKVQYTIEFGAKGKFIVDSDNGVITTQRDATFDFDLEDQYVLTVFARDKGNPQRTGSGTLTVNVLDLNNKNPYFTPTVQITSIAENAAIGTTVTTILANDLDRNNVLVYNLTEPVSAINPDGVAVKRSMVDYTKLFTVRNTTGEVLVAGKLDRDLTSLITYTMTVSDVFDPNNPQVGEEGKLQIMILEYNDQSPVFEQSVYNLTVEEEKTIGTFIIALLASDEDDDIARYEIVEGERELFLVTPDTGEMIVRRRLDYEVLTRTEFTVQAVDTGLPQRTGTAKVIVNILNINDNSPIPDEVTYYSSIPENSPGRTSVLRISATDHDVGDYGEVRYTLPETTSLFNIDNRTGELTLSANGEFDRERIPMITATVIIYDSPLDETVRRSSSVQVYVTLDDINDNDPVFSADDYMSAQIIESIDIGAQILQVFASDRDEGINALLRYEKVLGSGDPGDLFNVDQKSGRIFVANSLRNQVGSYVFRVVAKDLNGRLGYRAGYTTVNITVIESLNSVPVWIIPPNDNVTVEVLESQYLGMLVFDAQANDSNSGNNGIVEYFLQVAGKEVSSTKEFSINRVTGVIRAEMVFDREKVEKYTLHLVAKDKGYKPLVAERFLTVAVVDVNDNAPEFPMKNGITQDYNFVVPENATVNSVIGVIKATDKDLEMYTKIYYHILAGDSGKFAIGKETGEITLKESVDREEQEVYSMEIRATNGEGVDSSVTQLLYHPTDPSVVTVTITLQDVNDVAPYFTNFNGPRSDVLEYYAFISTDAAFDQAVVLLSATDDDYDDVSRITYDIVGGNGAGIFAINRNGLVTNQKLLDGLGGSVFAMVASASDQRWTATAPVKVFVADRGHEAKIIINRNQEDIPAITPQLIRKLESIDGIEYAGVTRVTNHIASSAVRSKSDVYVAAATALPGGGHRLLSSAELLGLIYGDREELKVPYDDLGVGAVGTAGGYGSWYDSAPVLAVLVVVLLLVILAVVLFCLACCCISELDRMRIKPKEKAPPIDDEEMLVDNPMDISGPVVVSPEDETDRKEVPTDDVYAAVMKPKPTVNQSETQDPQPFLENEEVYTEPVIETEVDEGEEENISIVPENDDVESVVIEASVMDYSEDEGSVVIEASVIDSSEGEPVDPVMAEASEPSYQFGSQESLTFDLEEAKKLYTVNTQLDSDFRTTALEPLEEFSEGSSQLNSTNTDNDDAGYLASSLSHLQFSAGQRGRGSSEGYGDRSSTQRDSTHSKGNSEQDSFNEDMGGKFEASDGMDGSGLFAARTGGQDAGYYGQTGGSSARQMASSEGGHSYGYGYSYGSPYNAATHFEDSHEQSAHIGPEVGGVGDSVNSAEPTNTEMRSRFGRSLTHGFAPSDVHDSTSFQEQGMDSDRNIGMDGFVSQARPNSFDSETQFPQAQKTPYNFDTPVKSSRMYSSVDNLLENGIESRSSAPDPFSRPRTYPNSENSEDLMFPGVVGYGPDRTTSEGGGLNLEQPSGHNYHFSHGRGEYIYMDENDV